MKRISPYLAWKKCRYPERTVLVVTKSETGRDNIMTAGWNMTTSNDPPLLAISIGLTRYSHQLIDETEEFVVSFPSECTEDAVQYCGSHSGRDVDKFKETGLTKVPSSFVKPPLIGEAVVNMECRLFKKMRTGDHTIFIGEILAAHISEGRRLITNNGGGRIGPI